MKKNLRYIFAVAGILIFAILIIRMGPIVIWSHITNVGWWTIPVLMLPWAWYSFHTLAWYQFLNPLREKIGFKELFRIKLIGEALNATTPIHFVAGDPARAYLLRYRYPITEGTASVVVDRTLYAISTLILILVGTAATLIELDFLPKNIKYGLPVVLIVASIFIGFVFIHQHKGLFSLLAGLAQRFKIKKSFSTTTLEKLEEVDGHIQDFYLKNKKGFWLALLFHTLGRSLGVLEFYLIGHALEPTFSVKAALLLGAAAPIISFTFAFIPGSLGAMESAASAIIYFLNYSPAIGLTIQIVRRLRGGLWFAIGFIFLSTHDREKLIRGDYLSSNISR